MNSQTCTTTLEYLDIVPPPHNNSTNADFLLTTSTQVCNPANTGISPQLDLELQFALEAFFVILGMMAMAWLLKKK